MRLDSSELQTAVIEYLRRRGVVIQEDACVRLEIFDSVGGRFTFGGCAPAAVVYNVQLPEGPYR